MRQPLPPTGPGPESAPSLDRQSARGRHTDDDPYIWGEENVDLTVIIEQAWADADTPTLHAVTRIEGVEERFREYAETRLKLISDTLVSFGRAVGRVAMDEINKAGTADNEQKDPSPKKTILPWPDREEPPAIGEPR